MTVPEHLQHKPIIAVNHYDKKDGKYAPNSDAKALSIGQAQYDKNEISAKIFRHTGYKWSRQSEELPIHRVLDLAIFIAASMQSIPTQKSISNLKETVIAPEKHADLLNYYKLNRKILQPRLDELKRLLATL
ncbi:MAG: hypothetical protein EOP54_11680 [Sphingobacteriales bacterium]|nr:MAG: hypothetical protein EOP54_11680 [Sphingobacteriales bacterium]